MKTTEKIIIYFKEHEELFNDCIEELDSYNGYLGDDRYYYMDELDELYNGTKPSEILCRAYYGRDDDTYTTDESGNRIYREFNPNREYFYFDGYGNFVSSDYKDYSYKLDEWAIQAMRENRYYIDYIDSDAELSGLFDQLENEQE